MTRISSEPWVLSLKERVPIYDDSKDKKKEKKKGKEKPKPKVKGKGKKGEDDDVRLTLLNFNPKQKHSWHLIHPPPGHMSL